MKHLITTTTQYNSGDNIYKNTIIENALSVLVPDVLNAVATIEFKPTPLKLIKPVALLICTKHADGTVGARVE